MKVNVRHKINFFLREFFRRKLSYNDLLAEVKLDRLSESDKALFIKITKGVIRNKTYLEFILLNYIKKLPGNQLLLFNMLSAIYQMFFLKKIPAYSAGNEAVGFTKAVRALRNFTSFTNAVLRKIAKEGEKEKIEEKLKALKGKDYLINRYSMPEWIIDTLAATYGEDIVARICEYFSKEPKHVICDFSAPINKSNLKKSGLVKKDAELEYSPFTNNIVVAEKSGISSDKLKGTGYYIADESSYWVAHVVNPEKGDEILDMCACPGGKSLHMALLEPGINVTSNDISALKLIKLQENIDRLKAGNIKVINLDAAKDDFGMKFDKILIDAPCTGFGNLQKKPDIKWVKSKKDIESLNKISLEILENACKHLKSQGEIIYSTCSILYEENEKVVERFLAKHPDFELVPLNRKIPAAFRKEKYYKVIPGISNCDGAFAAKVRKKDVYKF